MKIRLVTIGHFMKEMIIFPDRIIGPVLGGAASYSSVVASMLGIKTGVVSRIGNDMPKSILEPLYEAGVDMTGVKFGKKSRVDELIYDYDGNKEMKYIDEGEPILFSDIPTFYLEAEIIYICPQEGEVTLDLIERLHSRKIRLAAELGGFGGAHCGDHSKKRDKDSLRQLLSYFHIAKLSNEDAKYLFKGMNEEDIVRTIVNWGVHVSILTLADRGALLATSGEIFKVDSFTKEPLDCTGAGDCFAASFLVAYLMGFDFKKAGIFASAATSVLIEKEGGLILERMPTINQVKERLSKYDMSLG